MQLSSSLLLVLLVLANVAWGGAFIANVIALKSFSLGQILFFRVFFAALCYALMWRRYLPLQCYQKGDWRWLLALVLCEPCLLFLFETLGLRYTTASSAGIIAACVPIAVALGALFFYREKMGTRSSIGMLLALCGVAMVLFMGSGDATVASNPLLGNMFMVCAVLSSTAYTLLVKKLSARYPVLFISALQCMGSTLIFLPLALMSPLPSAPAQAWLSLVYLGFAVTFFSYLVINTAISKVKAGHVMLFTNLIPVSALVLAFFILDERMNALQYAGAAVVLGGMVLAGSPDATDKDTTAEEEAQQKQVQE